MKLKAKREKPIDVDVAIYRLHVIVIIGWTVDEIIHWGQKRGIPKEAFTEQWNTYAREASGSNGYCMYFGDPNADILVWLKVRPTKSSEYDTLWHELSHAVDFIAKQADPADYFYSKGMMSEPRAYLYEYLAVKITQVLWSRK